MSKGKLLIGSPICQKPFILTAFLYSLRWLELSDYEVYYHFIDDNYDQQSQKILKNFQAEKEHVVIERLSMQPTEFSPSHNWNQEKIWKVANYKDYLIQRARQENFDYLFLVDSDLLLYPRTIKQLVAADKEIISEVFWTQWSETAIAQPQVWLLDFYTQYEKKMGEEITQEEELSRTMEFYNKLRQPGVYEVGGLGACTLIAKSAIAKGISFQPIKNLTFWGEDRHFCIRACALEIELFVDTHYPAYHIFRDSEWTGGLQFLNDHVFFPDQEP